MEKRIRDHLDGIQCQLFFKNFNYLIEYCDFFNRLITKVVTPLVCIYLYTLYINVHPRISFKVMLRFSWFFFIKKGSFWYWRSIDFTKIQYCITYAMYKYKIFLWFIISNQYYIIFSVIVIFKGIFYMAKLYCF